MNIHEWDQSIEGGSFFTNLHSSAWEDMHLNHCFNREASFEKDNEIKWKNLEGTGIDYKDDRWRRMGF